MKTSGLKLFTANLKSSLVLIPYSSPIVLQRSFEILKPKILSFLTPLAIRFLILRFPIEPNPMTKSFNLFRFMFFYLFFYFLFILIQNFSHYPFFRRSLHICRYTLVSINNGNVFILFHVVKTRMSWADS